MLTVIADRGYFKGEEILACEEAGMTPLVPKSLTSGARGKCGLANRTLSKLLLKTSTAALPDNG